MDILVLYFYNNIIIVAIISWNMSMELTKNAVYLGNKNTIIVITKEFVENATHLSTFVRFGKVLQ